MLHRLIPWNDHEPLCFAIGSKDRLPKTELPVQWLRWNPKRMKQQVVIDTFDGVEAFVTTPARTIADCFAHRRRLNPGEPERMLELFRLCDLWDEPALREAAHLTRTSRLIDKALKRR